MGIAESRQNHASLAIQNFIIREGKHLPGTETGNPFVLNNQPCIVDGVYMFHVAAGDKGFWLVLHDEQFRDILQ
jgi:hypothetical protein